MELEEEDRAKGEENGEKPNTNIKVFFSYLSFYRRRNCVSRIILLQVGE